jgi:putative ABC transport system permease protein
MLHHIFKQLWAQRRYNGWIFAELMVVFTVVWALTDYAFVLLYNRNIPQGFDAGDTYMVSYGVYEEGMSRFRPEESDRARRRENLDLFVRKIREYGDVEYADLSVRAWGSLPFSGGMNSSSVIRRDEGDSAEVVTYAEVKLFGSGDYFRIFRYASAADGSWERPAGIDLLENSGIFITRRVERQLFGGESAVGRSVMADLGEGHRSYVVADVLCDQKRFEYELPGGAIFGAVSAHDWPSAVCLRVKRGTPEQRFIAGFRKEMTGELHIGNFYLNNIESFRQRREDMEYEFGVTNEARTHMALMVFFLLNIALGIIATFWFRNETRRSEIGLRMAMGSTRGVLQRQFITEAILLFTVAVIPAVPVCYAAASAGVSGLDMNILKNYESVKDSPWLTQHFASRFLVTNFITYLMLVIIILFSSWLPAYRASREHPVEALRDE